MAETILAKMAVELSANASKFNKGIAQSQGLLKGFNSSVQGIQSSVIGLASTLGIAFGLKEITSFTFEVAKLAGEAEGVRAAFEKLPQSEALMSSLKDATAGTVSELDLMKRTVQAANFGISLQSLPKLLEFAAIRAQQTGQSVDYLVDSIVTGIGRKSPLILDNLGISAVRLKEQFGGAALEAQSIGDVAEAVGRIATEELQRMGDFSENTSTKIQRLSASWEDLKVALGNAANNSGVIQKSLNIFTNFANALAGDELTTGINQLKSNMLSGSEILERFAAAGGKIDLSWQELMNRGFVRNEEAAKKLEAKLLSISKETANLTLANNALAVSIDPLTGVGNEGVLWKKEVVIKEVQTLETLKEKVKELNEQFLTTDIVDKKKLANTGLQILAVNKQIETLEKLRKKQDEINQLSAFGQQQLKDAETRSTGETPLTPRPLEFNFGPEDERDLTNIFPETIPPPDITGYMEALKTATDATVAAGAAGVQSYDQMRLAGEMQREEQERQSQAAMQFGMAIGDAFGDAISGEKTFAQAMKTLTKQIMLMFLQQALAAGIAGSFKTAKNPIIGAVLAGVATGVISAMFSKIGAPGGGSVGSGGISSTAGAENVRRTSIESQAQQITFDAEFTIKNSVLVAAVKQQENRSQQTG